MATQALIRQHIYFLSSNNEFDINAILANSLIQSMASNSQGSDVVHGFVTFEHWNGSAFFDNVAFEIYGYVSAVFAVTIQTNIPALQTAFPQYTIATVGEAVTYGN